MLERECAFQRSWWWARRARWIAGKVEPRRGSSPADAIRVGGAGELVGAGAGGGGGAVGQRAADLAAGLGEGFGRVVRVVRALQSCGAEVRTRVGRRAERGAAVTCGSSGSRADRARGVVVFGVVAESKDAGEPFGTRRAKWIALWIAKPQVVRECPDARLPRSARTVRLAKWPASRRRVCRVERRVADETGGAVGVSLRGDPNGPGGEREVTGRAGGAGSFRGDAGRAAGVFATQHNRTPGLPRRIAIWRRTRRTAVAGAACVRCGAPAVDAREPVEPAVFVARANPARGTREVVFRAAKEEESEREPFHRPLPSQRQAQYRVVKLRPPPVSQVVPSRSSDATRDRLLVRGRVAEPCAAVRTSGAG
jgi:hypothetical protein